MAISPYQTIPGTSPPFQTQERPDARTLDVVGAIAPFKLVPDLMNRAARSAVKDGGNAHLILQAGAEGLHGLRPTFGAALWQTLNPFNIFRSLKFGALVSFPIAFIQNFIAMRKGDITQNQMVAGTVADGIGYTVAGTIGTLIGGLVGSIAPLAGTTIGMLVGGAIGILGSEIYDKVFKPDFRKQIAAKMFG